MLYKPYPGTRRELDLLTCIAPIFRLDLNNGQTELIGTGFWATNTGHLVTAWHVVNENIGPDKVDRGPIFAIQTMSDRSVAVRTFVKTNKHPQFDLALSETMAVPPHVELPTCPIAMSLDDLSVGEPVFSFAVVAHNQAFENENSPGVTTTAFSGEISSPQFTRRAYIRFAVRLSFGKVVTIFEKMRDRVMLPFPCIQSDVPIYGGNSGGPLFDVRGRICAVNCTSFQGNDVSFHVPVQGVLHLHTRARPLGIDDSSRKLRSVLELAARGTILFDPPMLDADQFARSVLRWLWYAVKCLLRREIPSTKVHFATTRTRAEGSSD